jgi:WD40 repeat protein
MRQRWMTLMNGSHILADTTLVHDAGIANGAMLTVIRAEPHKILVARGNVAEVWNHEGRLDAVLRGHEDAITHVQFSPNRNLAITCCSLHGIAKLWEVGSQKCLFTLKHGDSGDSTDWLHVFSSTTSTTLVTISKKKVSGMSWTHEFELKHWCVSTGNCISSLKLSSGEIDIAATSQRVNVLHVRSSSIALLNMETGASVWEHQVEFPFSTTRGCLSRCGDWILTITRDRQTGHRTPDVLEIWNATTCTQRHTMRAREGSSINDPLFFSPDASRILFGNRRCGVTVWNVGHDHRVHKFKHESGGLVARFSPDGRELLTETRNRVWLWRIDDDTLVWCIPDVQVSGACLTPGGKGLVLRGDDGVEEWCTASRERCWKVGGKDISEIALSSRYEWRHRLW